MCFQSVTYVTLIENISLCLKETFYPFYSFISFDYKLQDEHFQLYFTSPVISAFGLYLQELLTPFVHSQP